MEHGWQQPPGYAAPSAPYANVYAQPVRPAGQRVCGCYSEESVAVRPPKELSVPTLRHYRHGLCGARGAAYARRERGHVREAENEALSAV